MPDQFKHAAIINGIGVGIAQTPVNIQIAGVTVLQQRGQFIAAGDNSTSPWLIRLRIVPTRSMTVIDRLAMCQDKASRKAVSFELLIELP